MHRLMLLMAMTSFLMASCHIEVKEKQSPKGTKESTVMLKAGPININVPGGGIKLGTRKARNSKRILVIRMSGLIRPTNREDLSMAKTVSLEYWLRLLRRGRDYGAVLIHLGNVSAPLEYTWELSNEIKELSKHTTVWIHAENLDTATYVMAVAGQKVFMEPLGSWEVRGVGISGMFFRGLLEKLGMKFDGIQIGQYKGAIESLTRDNFSPEFRQTLTKLVDSMYSTYISEVSAARSLDATAVREAIDTAVMDAKDAADKGLVDGVDHLSAVLESLKKQTGLTETDTLPEQNKKQRRNMSLFQLMAQMRPKDSISEPHVALVYAAGPIVSGSTGDSGQLFGNEAVYATSMVKTINSLKDNEYVKALVLRVDSPGGSALASREIWNALSEFRKTGRPVVVSMGRVAASGGYFIAAPATKILVSPFTITGSIGVVGGKMVIEGTLSKLSVTLDGVHRGKSWDMFSSQRPFTDAERQRLQKYMQRVYDDFTGAVLSFRRPYLKKSMDELAKGRIWTGRDAVDVGLADAIGGLADAMKEARSLAGLPPQTRVVEYPRPKGMLEALSEALSKMGPRDLNDLPQLMIPLQARVFLSRDWLFAMSPLFDWGLQ